LKQRKQENKKKKMAAVLLETAKDFRGFRKDDISVDYDVQEAIGQYVSFRLIKSIFVSLLLLRLLLSIPIQTPNPEVPMRTKRNETKRKIFLMKRNLQAELILLLDRGEFAVVHRCRSKKDGKEYAVKVIKKDKLETDMEVIMKELLIHSSLKPHPHIVNLKEFFVHGGLHIVLEL